MTAGEGGEAGEGSAAAANGSEGPPRRGRLFVVATPIGNLGDVTFRALETLRSVSVVAAEDTRLTRRLFARHDVSNRLVSYHARNTATKTGELLERLRAGDDVALVTDAGTPLVSDPGGELVAAWAAEGGPVIPIPGPSAALAALVASGVAGPRWAFEGFLPRSGRERRERLARLAADERASVIFEAPGRVGATLRDLAGACGGARVAAVARELTKVHESIVRGPLDELASKAASGEIPARGEFVIVLGAAARTSVPADADGGPARAAPDRGATTPPATDRIAAARQEVERLVSAGVARGAAARQVAASTNLPRRLLYGARRETPGD